MRTMHAESFRGARNTKLETNPKHQIANSKLQIPSSKLNPSVVWNFGHWLLEFVCDLVLGYCDLSSVYGLCFSEAIRLVSPSQFLGIGVGSFLTNMFIA